MVPSMNDVNEPLRYCWLSPEISGFIVCPYFFKILFEHIVGELLGAIDCRGLNDGTDEGSADGPIEGIKLGELV